MCYLSFLTISSFEGKSLGWGREVVLKIQNTFLRNLVKQMIFRGIFAILFFFSIFNNMVKRLLSQFAKCVQTKLSL